ncbi:MAG: outer membrane lipoprotein-sorting protein [Alphaproteobacteria bacterium GM7ARS4]|nr:outer membrane lipoprotein-sorting protein [Alphaproteobacteria bacterium GM7ARS4]
MIKYLFILPFIVTPAYADTTQPERGKDVLLSFSSPEKIGEEIALEYDRRDIGFESQIARMEMILRNAYGQENHREMESRTLERPALDVGDMSMLLFFSPRDLNGTAFLSHAEILEPDDQWLYLPSIKRVKRISSKNKSGAFLGLEFAYEDITGNEVGKYTWRYDAIEPCPGQETLECYRSTSVPRYEHSGYTKRVSWIDVDEMRLYRLDFYDRKGEKLKTQTNDDYKEYLGRYWRPGRLRMVNHQTGKSTELFFKDYQFKTGLTEQDFNQASLKRVR